MNLTADTITTAPNGDRYFSDGCDTWQWIDGIMFVNHGEESIFTSPEELLAYPGTFETTLEGVES